MNGVIAAAGGLLLAPLAVVWAAGLISRALDRTGL